jgi:PAS domain S-box-containing protein
MRIGQRATSRHTRGHAPPARSSALVTSARRPAAPAPPDAQRSVQIVESARDAIISTDRAGKIASWNRGAEEFYGYLAEEALDQPISLIIPESIKGGEWWLLRRVLTGERVDGYETSRVRHDGTTLHVSLTLFALHGAAGEITGAASITRDISARVAAEEDLRASEGRYRQILESATEGIWRTDAELITDYVNKSMAEMLGYAIEEMLGRPLSDFLDEDALHAATDGHARVGTNRRECSLLRKDGSELRALMSVNALFGEDGRPRGNLAMVTDLSRQRRAEADQRQTETFLAGLTASMEEGLLTLDAGGRIVTANESAERLLGYQQRELVGRELCACLGCRDREVRCCPTGCCRLAAINASTVPVRLEDELFLCKDGSELPVGLSVAPLGGDERPTGHVVVFRDISEQKAASELARRELEEIAWIGRLRDALDENRLVLAAQPIASLASGDVHRYELLVRLRDRSGLLIMPGSFLPAAERFGLIRELDRWVVGQAARLVAHGHSLNVNLSGHSLADPNLGTMIEKTLLEEGAAPELLTFEITETALTEHPKLAGRFAEQMAALGCQFALDDFGTGYGAFTYLKLMPIGYLKIDREFVHDLARSSASRHVVEAMVSLAHGFGQQTIAEGVEDEPTVEALRELGVDHVQGYYIGPPGPVGRVIGEYL